MCTLIVLHRCEEEVPLLAAANRDEYLDRPSSGLALRGAGERVAVAPRDLRAGGSWLGVNDAGVFAGLTNRPAARDESRLSRGGIVMEALACSSALEAARRLEQVPANAYNPFNCLVADRSAAFVAVYEDKPDVAELQPGVHVIGNADPDDRRNAKVARLLERAEAAAERAPEERLEAVASICRSHEGPGGPLGSPCVHAGSYGTRSSTLLRLARDPARTVLRHADGPPCETAHDDHTALLRELHRESQGTGAEANDARRER